MTKFKTYRAHGEKFAKAMGLTLAQVADGYAANAKQLAYFATKARANANGQYLRKGAAYWEQNAADYQDRAAACR